MKIASLIACALLMLATASVAAPVPTHGSLHPEATEHEKVEIYSIHLMGPEDEFTHSIKNKALADFLQNVEAQARGVLNASKHGSELTLQFDCTKAAQKFTLVKKDKLEADLVEKLNDAMSQVSKLPLEGKDVAFQVVIKVAS